MSEFQIFALSVGKGTLALSPCPGGTSAYTDDLYTIQDWRPSFVISMTPLEELERIGASALPNDVPGLGARWIHLPVADFGAPSDKVTALWATHAPKVRQALAGGGRVLIHCRGGCGRSGMLALRLMVEMGEDVTEALARLRYVRHCAIETDAQFDWAASAANGTP